MEETTEKILRGGIKREKVHPLLGCFLARHCLYLAKQLDGGCEVSKQPLFVHAKVPKHCITTLRDDENVDQIVQQVKACASKTDFFFFFFKNGLDKPRDQRMLN